MGNPSVGTGGDYEHECSHFQNQKFLLKSEASSGYLEAGRCVEAEDQLY